MRTALQLLGGLAALALFVFGTRGVEGCLESPEPVPGPRCSELPSEAALADRGGRLGALTSALLASPDNLLVRAEGGPVALLVGRAVVLLVPPGDLRSTEEVLDAALAPLPPESQAALGGRTALLLWLGRGLGREPGVSRPAWNARWRLDLFHDDLTEAGCLVRAPVAPEPSRPLSRRRSNELAVKAAKAEGKVVAALGQLTSAPALEAAALSARATQARKLLFSEGVWTERARDLPDAALVLLVVLLVFYWRTSDAAGQIVEFEVELLRRAGAYQRDAVRAGQRERLVAYGLQHASLQHLANNALALWLGAYLLEPAIGSARTTLVFLGGVLAAGLARHALDRPGVLVGASGGTFALKGAALALTLRAGPWVPELERTGFLMFLGILLVVGLVASFMPGVSLLGHGAGALAGAALAGSGLLTWGRPTLEGGPESALASGAAWALAGLALLAWIGCGLLAWRNGGREDAVVRAESGS